MDASLELPPQSPLRTHLAIATTLRPWIRGPVLTTNRRVLSRGVILALGALCLCPPLLPDSSSGLFPQDIGDPLAPSWEELQARPYPQWFLDAKLGIFIHWGVYSVPAYSGKEDYAEWFVRGLQEGDSLRTRFVRENFGPEFRYRDFAPLFQAELFDPEEWAGLFSRAGARYVVLVSKHHDGYALWPSAHSPGWNSVEVGPRRDLVGDLSQAVRAAGLKMGLYYSLAEWEHPLHRWDTDPPDSIGPYVSQYMIPQFRELISTYRPSVLFTDGEWSNSAAQWKARELIGWYFETVGPEAVVNDRWGAGSDIGFRTPEYSAGMRLTERPWAEVRGLGRSFGLNRNEKLEAYLSPAELIHSFARAVAGGGGMILNVGPKADGQIPLLQQERLLQLGDWLKRNGEAIYGARPWIKSSEMREVALERIDPNIDFDWVRNGPGRPIREDEFTAVWTGFLEAPVTAGYTFWAEADDQVSVWLENRWVAGTTPDPPGRGAGAEAENPHDVSPNVSDGIEPSSPDTVFLQAGVRYPIRIEYREEDVNASVRFFWTRGSSPKEIVPADAFFTEPGPEAGQGLRARYTSRQESMVYTRKGDDLFVITFQWPDSVLAVPIPRPDPELRIRLLGTDQTLPWQYEGGKLMVDFSGVPYSQIPGEWAWTVRLEGYAGPERGMDADHQHLGEPG